MNQKGRKEKKNSKEIYGKRGAREEGARGMEAGDWLVPRGRGGEDLPDSSKVEDLTWAVTSSLLIFQLFHGVHVKASASSTRCLSAFQVISTSHLFLKKVIFFT